VETSSKRIKVNLVPFVFEGVAGDDDQATIECQ